MTRDEAVAYIQSHPAMFKGYQLETVLARINSTDNPDFYDPTLFSVQEGDRGASAPAPTPKATAKRAPVPAYVPPSKANALASVGGRMPALPVTLAVALLVLGAGAAIYRATR